MLKRFASETEVEGYIRSLVEEHITRLNPKVYALKNKKTVDILICRDGEQPALFIIEVKYHQLSHGRLGFGGREGGGFQPEIVKRAPAYFEENLRWVLASDRHVGKGVLFAPSSVIRKLPFRRRGGREVQQYPRKDLRRSAFPRGSGAHTGDASVDWGYGA